MVVERRHGRSGRDPAGHGDALLSVPRDFGLQVTPACRHGDRTLGRLREDLGNAEDVCAKLQRRVRFAGRCRSNGFAVHISVHERQPVHQRRGENGRVMVGAVPVLDLWRFGRFLFPPQVILRLLDPSISTTLDPYSPEAVARLALTNLRIRLLKAQACPPPAEAGSAASSPTSAPTAGSAAAAPYAVYTFLARGTCLCHGHAEHCVPHNSSGDKRQDQNTVSRFSSEFKSKWARTSAPDGKYQH